VTTQKDPQKEKSGKKLLEVCEEVDRCEECLYHYWEYESCVHPKGLFHATIYNPCELGFPDWCPLPDVEEE